jgi:hypothetical protein
MPLLAGIMNQDDGGKKCAGLDVPRGCSMKRRISIPQVMLTIAGLLRSSLTTWMPWTTLRTDWAGAKTLPASVIEIPNIPTILSIAFAMPLFSRKSGDQEQGIEVLKAQVDHLRPKKKKKVKLGNNERFANIVAIRNTRVQVRKLGKK